MNVAMPTQIELLGGFDFDFVFLDGEHGMFDVADIEQCCRAAELYDLTIVARVAANDANLISRYLNAGVQGIVVPHVDTAAEARIAIESCRYAPQGLRPSGGSRSSGYWRGINDMAANLEAANANVTLSVQLESVEAVENLPEMLDLGGIDYFTIGKQDLAQSMGFSRLAEGIPPEVDALAQRAADLIHSRGGKLKDDVMTVGRVNRFLADGAARFLATANKASR